MSDKEPEVIFLTQKELLEGLLQITGNLGVACTLLDRVINVTEEEFKITRQEIKDNISAEKRNARRRKRYRFNINMVKCWRRKKPDGTFVAHHIVALTDPRAEQALIILLSFGIDPNDAINGVYLPRFVKDTPHSTMPDACAHSTIHTDMYYANVVVMLRRTNVPGATKTDIENVLQEIALSLQVGTFPIDKPIKRGEV